MLGVPAMKIVLFFVAAALVMASPKGGSTYHAPRASAPRAPKIHAPKVSTPRIRTPKPPKAAKLPKSTSKRDPAERSAFVKSHPCPSTGKTSGACPGYVVDHVRPLACGGADSPSNMQWQTEASGKIKDAYERNGCR